MGNLIEDTAYIGQEINQLCQRLEREGMDVDLVYASLLNQAAYGYANIDGSELMPAVFRETADQMERGEYKHRTTPVRPRPKLTIIEGLGSGDQN